MFAWKTLLDYTNLFSLNNYKKNDKKQVLSLDEENLIIVSSTVNGCISISAFASLVSIAVGIISSAVELNICAIIAAKKFKSIIKKKKKLS